MTDLAVIMSVYHNDRLDYVKESVQSILNQTYTDFDYYIAFDGPVGEEIDRFFSSLGDSRIRLFRLEKNSGLALALNYLLEIVLRNDVYRLIARMDADDISVESRFEKQRNFLLKNPEISCVGSWYQEIDETSKHLTYKKLPVDHDGLRRRYFTRTPFAHPSVMYRKELIERAGFYPTDTILMEDNVLWGKALQAGLKFANIPEYLFQFRIDKNFYERRTGLKYGWNYIKTRFSEFRKLKTPFHFYFFSVGIGLLKMIPPFFLKIFYQLCQR